MGKPPVRAPVAQDLLAGVTAGQEIILGSDTAHYLVRVRRLRDNAPVELFTTAGLIARGQLQTAPSPRVVVEEVAVPSTHEARPLILAQALAKGDKLDQVVRRAVEVGATAIWLYAGTRSVVRPRDDDDVNRVERLERIAVEAARQAGRNLVPPIRFLPDAALRDELRDFTGLKAFGALDAHAPLSQILRDHAESAARGVLFLVGPEGGIDEKERRQWTDVGCEPVRLGLFTLRTETAGLVALAVVQAHFGHA